MILTLGTEKENFSILFEKGLNTLVDASDRVPFLGQIFGALRSFRASSHVCNFSPTQKHM